MKAREYIVFSGGNLKMVDVGKYLLRAGPLMNREIGEKALLYSDDEWDRNGLSARVCSILSHMRRRGLVRVVDRFILGRGSVRKGEFPLGVAFTYTT